MTNLEMVRVWHQAMNAQSQLMDAMNPADKGPAIDFFFALAERHQTALDALNHAEIDVLTDETLNGSGPGFARSN